jgi:3-oxoacyl-[acyl-carrier protein] reductase
MMLNFRALQGKRALITGASRGIGLQMVESFSAAGADIIACVRNSEDKFVQRLQEISTRYANEIQVECFDLSDSESIKISMKSILKSKPQIDVLVNNAGKVESGLFSMTTMESMRDVFQINYFAAVQISQSISRLMMRQKSGVIINVASIAGIDSFPGYCSYGGSKAALIQFTKTAASELSSYGIRVNAIAPSLVQTDMADVLGVKAQEGIFQRSLTKRSASPSEIANIVIFLASDESSYLNGQVIRIDGGM